MNGIISNPRGNQIDTGANPLFRGIIYKVLQDDGADRSAHCRQPRYCRGHCGRHLSHPAGKDKQRDEHEQPVKWLFRVLKNNAISEYRAQCRHAAAPLEESILRAADPELIPFSGMLPKGLSASEQRILTLRLAEDMDYSTISEKLGISETACRSQYSRARRHCAELMERSDDNAGF